MFRTSVGAVLVVGLVSGAAEADPVVFSGVEGTWQDPVGGDDVSIDDAVGTLPDMIRWGIGTDIGNFQQSGYILDFVDQLNDGVGLQPDPNVPFVFALFTHENFDIDGAAITAVDFGFSFDINGTPSSVNRLFRFVHDETDNQCDEVADPGCSDDIVTIGSVTGAFNIDVNGMIWQLELLGFSPDDGATFQDTYISPENDANQTELFAIVRPVSTPEAGSLILLGLGCLGLGIGRRLQAR